MLEQVGDNRSQVVGADDKGTLTDLERGEWEQARPDDRKVDQAGLKRNGAFANKLMLFVAVKFNDVGDLMENVGGCPEEENGEEQVQIEERQRDDDDGNDNRRANEHRVNAC